MGHVTLSKWGEIMSTQAKHTFPRIVFRYVAGRDLDGQRRTNATFLRHADRDLTDHGRAGRWAHRRHAERAAWRLGGLTFVSGAVCGLILARTLTLAALAVCGLSGLAYVAYASVRGIRYWTHNRHIVSPLYQTLAPIAGHPVSDHHKRYLTVPRDIFDNDKARVKLALSPLWEGTVAQQKAITGLMSRRLNADLEGRWYPHAIPPFAEFGRAPSPPGKVTFAEFKPFMDVSPPHIIPMGLGSNKQLVQINLDDEAPHIALSVGTGGGKTSMMALVIAFLVHMGVERIDVINTKRAGYAWCAGLPGVFVHNNMASQMEAIHNFHARMSVRYDEFEFNDTLTFPRQVLIIEEQNSWMKMAKKFWEDYRLELDSKERGNTPKQNPAIGEIGLCLFMGRQACMNIISIFQRMSASAAGDGDMRDQYGAKLLARTSRQAWKILVGTMPVPKDCMSTIRGRAVFVLGDVAHPIQIAYLTPNEARAYALAGRTADITGPGTPITSGASEMYSLREIADGNVIPIKYGALRKARQRDKERFPAAVNGLYVAEDIKTWYANRPSTKRAA